MPATTFWGVCNGGFGQVADGELNNVTAALTVNMRDAGTTDRFTDATFPFLVTIHDGDLPPESPHLDENMEIAIVESFPDTDQMELNRPNPKPHTGEPHIQLMVLMEHVKELQDAINELEERWVEETPSGDVDGVNVNFTSSREPLAGTTPALLLRGLERTPGVEYTWTGTAIEYLPPIVPMPGDRHFLRYQAAPL